MLLLPALLVGSIPAYPLTVPAYRKSTVPFFKNTTSSPLTNDEHTADGAATTDIHTACGDLHTADSRIPTSQLHTGGEMVAARGLYYLRARLMNPLTGRFWTADSYEGAQTDPQSLHKYLYANADPLNRLDPSGRFSLTELSIVTYVQLTTLAAAYPATVAILGSTVAALNIMLFVQDEQFHGEFISAFGPGDAGVILAADARLIYRTGTSFFKFLKAVGTTASAFEQLAALRRDLNLPLPSGKGDVATLSKLEIGNANFLGISAHGTEVSVTVNPISETHAEIDALNQAFEAGIKADEAVLYVDNPMCGACGTNGAVRRVAEQLGLRKLTVRTPAGTTEYIIESNQ